MTLDALKSVKLRKSKKKVVSPSKRKKPDRASPKVGGGWVLWMLPASVLFVAEEAHGAAAVCVSMWLQRAQQTYLTVSHSRAILSSSSSSSPSSSWSSSFFSADGNNQVLFQLKKTSRSVPRSPGGTPLLSKKKRRMSILGS